MSTKQRTKVVVRRLPPGLTEDAFKSTISKIIPDTQYNYFAYFQGKVSLRKTVLSRAYINFIDPADVFLFKSKFDGHVFITTKGSQFKCAVEYTPFQKVPNAPKKRNPLEGTIDQDPHYQEFLKHLESGPELLPSAAVQREQEEKAAAANAAAGAQADGGVKVTPLMEYLRNKYLSNPGLRLGGARRNKGKAASAPLPPKAGRGGGRGAPPTKGGPGGKPGLWEQPIPEESGPVGAPAGSGKPAGGPGRGGGRQQQGRGPGPAPSSSQPAAAGAQQQRASEKGGAGRGGGPFPSSRPTSAAPPAQQQQQDGRREGAAGSGARAAARPSSVQPASSTTAGTSTVPTAAGAGAGGGPVKVMARPGSQQQQQQFAAASSGAGAAASRPAQAAAPAAATAPPAAAQGPAAAPAAPAGGAADAQQQPQRAPRERRVRAGFQPFQPRRRGAEDNDYG